APHHRRRRRRRRRQGEDLMVGPVHYLVLAAILFALGAAGVVIRRNAIIVLMSIEIMLNAVNLSFLAFSRFPLVPVAPMQAGIYAGQVAVFFVIAVAAAEAAVGLAGFVRMSGEEGTQFHESVYTWFAVGSLHVDLALSLDRLSGALVLVITGVGFLIHLYSVGYIDEDPGYWRYFAYLNLFVAAMLLLVLGDNLVAMFVGWEGVGLCSYLLIGFWFDDDAKAYAGRKAFIVNRIGDFGFLIGIFILFNATGHVDFAGMRASPLPYAVAM